MERSNTKVKTANTKYSKKENSIIIFRCKRTQNSKDIKSITRVETGTDNKFPSIIINLK